MGEYHDLYLRTDILLLGDVFENFRVICLENFELDPCHYVSSPGLSWDAMLKMTGINLELITDIDQQLFIEKGMHGGISIITHRYAKANNRYMKDYKHAKKVWDTFDLKNMGEYHDLYLHTDILLLADVFENFRKL